MDALQRTWEKRRQRQDGPPKTTEKDVRRQLAWATGSEFFSHRDPKIIEWMCSRHIEH